MWTVFHASVNYSSFCVAIKALENKIESIEKKTLMLENYSRISIK